MSESLIVKDRSKVPPSTFLYDTAVAGPGSANIFNMIASAANHDATRLTAPPHKIEGIAKRDIAQQLFDGRSQFKRRFALVSMHLPRSWRETFFKQIDVLLDLDNWDEDDAVLSEDSIDTAIRALVYLDLKINPGVGVTADGNLALTWVKGTDRLTIICLPNDKVQVIVNISIDEEPNISSNRVATEHITKLINPHLLEHFSN